jgi:hypothetical protein
LRLITEPYIFTILWLNIALRIQQGENISAKNRTDSTTAQYQTDGKAHLNNSLGNIRTVWRPIKTGVKNSQQVVAAKFSQANGSITKANLIAGMAPADNIL